MIVFYPGDSGSIVVIKLSCAAAVVDEPVKQLEFQDRSRHVRKQRAEQ